MIVITHLGSDSESLLVVTTCGRMTQSWVNASAAAGMMIVSDLLAVGPGHRDVVSDPVKVIDQGSTSSYHDVVVVAWLQDTLASFPTASVHPKSALVTSVCDRLREFEIKSIDVTYWQASDEYRRKFNDTWSDPMISSRVNLIVVLCSDVSFFCPISHYY